MSRPLPRRTTRRRSNTSRASLRLARRACARGGRHRLSLQTTPRLIRPSRPICTPPRQRRGIPRIRPLDRARRTAPGAAACGKAQMKRILLFAAGMAAGVVAVIAIVAFTGWPLPFTADHDHGGHAHTATETHGHDGPERIALSEAQIGDAGITLAEVKGGDAGRHFLVPGSHRARAATASRASRCVCSAPSPNCASGSATRVGEGRGRRRHRKPRGRRRQERISRRARPPDLQQTLLRSSAIAARDARDDQRERFLRTQLPRARPRSSSTPHARSCSRSGSAETEIAALPQQPVEGLRRQESARADGGPHRRAPRRPRLAGRPRRPGERTVRHRRSRRGVGRARGRRRPTSPRCSEGQRSRVMPAPSASGATRPAKIIFVSPLLDKETRTARVVAIGRQRRRTTGGPARSSRRRSPSATRQRRSSCRASRAADHRGAADACSCARRRLRGARRALGREDDDAVEIVSGLAPGETIAAHQHLRAQGRARQRPKPSTSTEGTDMIERILDFSIRRRWLVVSLVAVAAAFGVYALTRLPIDAVPDITNNQVQINTVGAGALAGRGREAGHVPDRDGARRHPGPRVHALALAQRLLAGHGRLRGRRRHLLRPPAGRRAAGRGAREPARRRRAAHGPDLDRPRRDLHVDRRVSTTRATARRRATASPAGRRDGSLPDAGRRAARRPTSSAPPTCARCRTGSSARSSRRVPGVAGVDAIGGYVKQYHVAARSRRSSSRSGCPFADVARGARERNNVSRGAGYHRAQRRGLSSCAPTGGSSTLDEIGNVVVATRGGVPIRVRDVADGRDRRASCAPAAPARTARRSWSAPR